MNEHPPPPADPPSDEALTAQALREHAEVLARSGTANRADRQAALSPEAVRHALHELQVHQIELEMQNDELRRSQRELEAARARYFDLYDLAPVGYCTVSAEGLILQANLAAAALFGVARGALTRQPFSRFVLAADADRWQLCRRQLAETGAAQTLELRLAQPAAAPGVAGTPETTVQVSASAVRDADATPLLRVVLTDISERKRAEAALLRSEARFRSLVESDLLGLIFWARDGRIAQANDAFLRMVGYSRAELQGGQLNWAAMTPPEYRALDEAALADVALRGSCQPYEKEYLRRDGSRLPILIGGASFTEQPGEGVAFVLDISERRRANRALQASLREKEALLKEVHHRVKNNLQVIHSLLRLETGRNPQPEVKQVLRAMQARIVSMALLHETLYRSGSFAAVDLGHYLQQLATQAFQAQTAGHGKVTLELALASVQVTMDQAIACGLLVNELVSNSLKHAFPDGRAGTLRVALRCLATDGTEGATLSLCVSDDGVGLPADFEARRGESLGLQLVADLAQQLGASLNFGAGPGSAVELIFAPQRALPAADFPPPTQAAPTPAQPRPDPTPQETAP